MTRTEQLVVRPSETGMILIGDRKGSPTGMVWVHLRGITVGIDSARPQLMPIGLVADPDEAAAAIEVLYGSLVSDAVLQAETALLRGESGEVTVSAAGDMELDDLARLGQVRWCQSSSPLPLDESLLALEELILRGKLADLLDADDDWLSQLTIFGDAMINWVSSETSPHLDGMESLVMEGLALLAARLPVTDRLAGLAAAALRSVPVAREVGSADDDWLAELADLLRPAGAVLAGDRDDLYVGTSTVDWLDVPRGQLSTDEQNVVSEVRFEDDSATVSVTVGAGGRAKPYPGFDLIGSDEPDVLAFDVQVPSWRFPVLTGELRPDADTGTWHGSWHGSGPQVELLAGAINRGESVDVRVRTPTLSPRQHQTRSAALRWAGRGLGLTRLWSTAARPGTLTGARSAWQRAALLWTSCGGLAEAEICQDFAEAVRSLSAGSSDGLTGAVDQVGPADLSPTLAERWLVAGGSDRW